MPRVLVGADAWAGGHPLYDYAAHHAQQTEAGESLTVSDLTDIFHQRRWWSADVRRGADGIVLVVRPGVLRTTFWRKSGEVFNETLDRNVKLEASVGDRFVCCGLSIDETMAAEVTAVDGARLHVALTGELGERTAVVRLLGMRGLAKQAKRKKAA